MTFVTRYNPRSDFRTLQSRFFEPFFGRFNFLDDALPTDAWAPPVDVAEDKDKIVVKVEVPGMSQDDLKVHFEDGLLTVSGEREFERNDDRSFVRTFGLPRSVEGNSIVANYKDGILEIAIPKKEEAKSKEIQINA